MPWLMWAGLIAGALLMTGAVATRQIFALRENHDLVVRDSLTVLASRIFVHDMLHRAVDRTRRTGRPAAVLLIDLNGFKPVNDRYGHAAGDEVLTAFGARLRSCVQTRWPNPSRCPVCPRPSSPSSAGCAAGRAGTQGA